VTEQSSESLNDVRSSGPQTEWTTTNWATRFGQLGDRIANKELCEKLVIGASARPNTKKEMETAWTYVKKKR